jgi:Ca2+-binding RTX toxin-like protein
MIRRMAAASAIGATILLGAPAAALAAATVTWSVGASTLTVTDAADQATTFDISHRFNGAGTADDVLRIQASGGIAAAVSAEEICHQFNATTLDCDHYATGPVVFDLFDLRAGNSDDTINMDAATMTAVNLQTTGFDLYGEDGHDTINGTARGDVIYGGAGNDDIYANDGNDVVFAGEGSDDIFGGDGADGLNGQGGSDRFRPGLDGDVDTIDGGETDESPVGSNDMVMLNAALAGVTVTLGDGLANDGPDNEDYDATIESVEGSLFDDHITLGAGGGTVLGSDGNDVIVGGAGNDILWGEDGNDDLTGNAGADSYFAGNGDDVLHNALDGAVDILSGGEGGEVAGDTVTFAGSAVGVNVTMNDGNGNDGAGADAETVDSSIEQVTGTSHADTIVGDSFANALRGGDGDDVLDARDSGIDTLIDCGGGTDIARFDSAAAGGVDDPAPVACESLNPAIVAPPVGSNPTDPTPTDPAPPVADPIATRLAGSTARIIRVRCSRAQLATGVRDGDRRWCYRLVVRTTLRRADGSAVVAGQRVNVLRVVARRQVLLQRATTNARGIADVSRPIVVPRAQRSSLATADRWLAAQYRTTRLRHVAGGDYAAARVVTVVTRR